MSQGFSRGIPIDVDGSLTNNSDSLVPSQKAVRTYVNTLAANLISIQSAISDDTSLNATVYPIWSAAASGNNALKVSSTKIYFNPSTGMLTTTALTVNQVYGQQLNGVGGMVTGYAGGTAGTFDGISKDGLVVLGHNGSQAGDLLIRTTPLSVKDIIFAVEGSEALRLSATKKLSLTNTAGGIVASFDSVGLSTKLTISNNNNIGSILQLTAVDAGASLGTTTNTPLNIFVNTSTNAIQITAAGNVGILKSPSTALDVSGTVTAGAFAGNGAAATPLLTLTGTGSGSGGGSWLILRGDGSFAGGPGMASGNRLGFIGFRGNDGSAYATGSSSSIESQATETWTGSAQGSSLIFSTTPNTTTGALARLNIGHDGIVTASVNFNVSRATGSTYFANAGYVAQTTDASTSNTTHKVSPYIALYGSIWNGAAAQVKGVFAQVGGISGTNTAYQMNFASSDVSNILVLRGDNGNVGLATQPDEILTQTGKHHFLGAAHAVYALPSSGYVTYLDLAAGASTAGGNGASIRLDSAGAGADGTITLYTNQSGIGASARLTIPNTGQPTISAARTDINNVNNLMISDTTAMAANVGGGISFRGKYTAAGAYTEFGAIHAYKDNATDGNYAAGLAFYTRTNGSGAWTVLGASGPGSAGYTMKLDSAGSMTLYGVANAASFAVNGGASQYSAYVSVRGSAQSQIEWGHSNTGGYASTIGAENSSGNPYIAFQAGKGTNNNTYKTFGLVGMVLKTDTSGNMFIGTVANSNADNQTLSTKMIIGASGSVIIGDNANALATNATAGFLYIPTCAGAPTGVPTAIAGTKALVYDTTNNNLYVYNGAWKKVALA